MTEKPTEKTFNIFGGSSASKWSVCYGYAAEMSKLPMEPPGPPAIKGTAIHSGVERKVRAEIEYRIKGTPVSVDYSDIPDWPDDGPTIADDFWSSLWTKVLEEIITGKTIYVEKKLMLFPDKDAGGTADIIVLYKNDKGQLVGVIGDLKTGYIRVEPNEEQLRFYLCALYLRYKEKGFEIEVFKSFVFQPSHHTPYTAHTFSKKNILTAISRYEKAIAASYAEKPKYKVGSHCKYCRAQPVCRAYNKHITKQLDVEVRTELPSVDNLPDETLLKVFKASDQIESYISAIRKHIVKRFANGSPVPGLKLVSGVSKRKWKDTEYTRIVLKNNDLNYVREDLVGIGEIEKQLKAQGKAKKDIEVFMYDLTEKPPAHPKVVEESDPREAIRIESAVELLSIEEEE